MRILNIRVIAVALLMFSSAVLAFVLTPTQQQFDETLNLEALLPRSFGGWKIDPKVTPVTVSPEVRAQLEKIYSQTVSRTYINDAGERVMLSIAYGGDQSRSLQVHRPEVCYVSQGFGIRDIVKGQLAIAQQNIPVMRLVAFQGPRVEPITYWVRIGDRTVRGNLEQGLARVAYGLSGRIPDGLLFRVSTIGTDSGRSFAVQDKFVGDLLSAIPPDKRGVLLGMATD